MNSGPNPIDESVRFGFQQWCALNAPRISQPILCNPGNASICYDPGHTDSILTENVSSIISNNPMVPRDDHWDRFKAKAFDPYQRGGSLWEFAKTFRTLWNREMYGTLRVVFAIEWSVCLFTVLFHLLMFWVLHRLHQQGRGFSALHNSLMINDVFGAVGFAVFDLDILVVKHKLGKTNIVCTPWAWPALWQRTLFESVSVLFFVFQFGEIQLLLALTWDRIQAILQPIDYRVHNSFRRGLLVNVLIYTVNGCSQLWYTLSMIPEGLPANVVERPNETSSILQNSSERYPLPRDWQELVCLKQYQLLSLHAAGGNQEGTNTSAVNYYWSSYDLVCEMDMRGDILTVIGVGLFLIPGSLLVVSVIFLVILLRKREKEKREAERQNGVQRIQTRTRTSLKSHRETVGEPSSRRKGDTAEKNRDKNSSLFRMRSIGNNQNSTNLSRIQNGKSGKQRRGEDGSRFGKSQTIILLYENINLFLAALTLQLPFNPVFILYSSMLSMSFRYLTAPFCIITISRKFRTEMFQFPLISWSLKRFFPVSSTEHPMLIVSIGLLVLFFLLTALLIPMFLVF